MTARVALPRHWSLYPGAIMHAYLFAHPAAHSLSPRLHAAAFAHCGLPGAYQARDVPPEGLRAALEGLRSPDTLGANLSLPHKEAALEHLDWVSPEAQAIGAVNTVVHRAGRLEGLNTDAPGLLAALEDAGYHPQGTALVLGAGGAARAAVYALHHAGVQVWLYNRTPARARALLEALAPNSEVLDSLEHAPWSELDLLVNASSAGLNRPEESPLLETGQALEGTITPRPFPSLASGALVYDMVYKPLETRLVRDARAAGLRAESGLGMLVHQARLAFTAWTGYEVPAGVMRAALDGALD